MKISVSEKFGAAGFLALVVLWVAAICGWIANVVSLIGMLDGPLSAMFVARIVGVFFAPLGAILGFF